MTTTNHINHTCLSPAGEVAAPFFCAALFFGTVVFATLHFVPPMQCVLLAGEVVAIFSAALLGIPECLNPVQVGLTQAALVAVKTNGSCKPGCSGRPWEGTA